MTVYRPRGGEVCKLKHRGQFGKSSDYNKYYGCEIMLKYFDKFNFDVLNGSDWSGSNSRFEKQGCWERIRDYLGYRFVIKASKYEGGKLYFSVENVGFGKSFKSRKLSVKMGEKVIETSIDVKNWHSGGTFEEVTEIGMTELKEVELQIEGNIQFANQTGNTIFLRN